VPDDNPNTDERFYEHSTYSDEVIAWACRRAAQYFDGWRPRIRELRRKRDLRVLDIGSGTCALAMLLSAQENVAGVVATDISPARMRLNVERVSANQNGDLSKVDFQRLDFNEKFPFEDGAFDLVTADAALHHSQSMWFTLSEINRVLSDGGAFAAQREAFLATITASFVMRRLLRSPEFEAGVSENAYLKSQYAYYLSAAGFSPTFIPWIPDGPFRAAPPLNGHVFARYLIWAPKSEPPRYSSRPRPS